MTAADLAFNAGLAAAVSAVAGIAERLRVAPCDSPAQRARMIEFLMIVADEIAAEAKPVAEDAKQ